MSKTRKGRSQAMERANVFASDLADRIAPTVESARDRAVPVIADARDKAAPAFGSAKDRFNSDVLPALTAAAVAAGEATEEVRGETRKRSKAAVAALKGEIEAPKETHRFRNFLVVLGLGGIAAAVAKKLSDRPATTTWQSTPTSTPSSPPTSSPTFTPEPASSAGTHRAPVGDPGNDFGGASPDVAAADAAASPHPASTPDDPVTIVDLSKK